MQNRGVIVNFQITDKNVFPHLDHSIWSDVLQFFLRGRVLWGRNPTSLSLFRRVRFDVPLSRTSVSEDTHNKEIDGKHDDWTLNSDHNLLPGELDMTCKENCYF